MSNILVTGGLGFIGSNFVRMLLGDAHFVTPNRKIVVDKVVVVDSLAIGSNIHNLSTFQNDPRLSISICDIRDTIAMERLIFAYSIDTIVHFAAESHVDRAIVNPNGFVSTNVEGTISLMNAARRVWGDNLDGKRFHHISTDEVYGQLLWLDKPFTEDSPYKPRNPYSSSKAGSDFMVMSYYYTYGFPITISNCSNNYGRQQYKEKFIPTIIDKIKNNKPIPVYGNGKNVRDWIHVEDHCNAIIDILKEGKIGEKYNIGSNNEVSNVDLVRKIIELAKQKGPVKSEIQFVNDRPGHDFRYAIDSSKIQTELGWKSQVDFDEGLNDTIDWYLSK